MKLPTDVKTTVLKAALDVGFHSACVSVLQIAENVVSGLGKKELKTSVVRFLEYTLSEIQKGRRLPSLTGNQVYEDLVKSAATDAATRSPPKRGRPRRTNIAVGSTINSGINAATRSPPKRGRPRKTNIAVGSTINSGIKAESTSPRRSPRSHCSSVGDARLVSTTVVGKNPVITEQNVINNNRISTLRSSATVAHPNPSTPIATGLSDDVIKALEKKMEKFIEASVERHLQKFTPVVAKMIESAFKARFPTDAAEPAAEQMDEEVAVQVETPREIHAENNNVEEDAAPPPTEVPGITNVINERMEELFRGLFQNQGVMIERLTSLGEFFNATQQQREGLENGGNVAGDVAQPQEQPQQQVLLTNIKPEVDATENETSGELPTSSAGVLPAQ